MRSRLALFLPGLCGLLVVLTIVWGSQRSSPTAAGGRARRDPAAGVHVDPVCNMEVGGGLASRYRDRSWYFCADRCRRRFDRDPERYLGELCIVCRNRQVFTRVGGDSRFAATWQGATFRFCSAAHRAAFREDPAAHFMHSMWGIPGWLYYSSIAVILVLSFGVFEWSALRRARPAAAAAGGARAAAVDAVPAASAAAGAGGAAPAPTPLPAAAGAAPLPPGRPRYDLFRVPGLRRLLSSARARFVLRALLVLTFALIIGAGLFGNQLPSKNIAPLLTWTIWWGGLIWLVAYAGKLWCYVCPWDAIAEWAEGLRLWGRRRAGLGLGLGWPRLMRNIWPATLLFIALTWIELGFGVTMKPRATAWLGLIMLGLAFASAFIFDRKSFCRYGCLVGRISGLYALFAPVELRARDRAICRDCETLSCYRGNDRGEGCPTFEFPARMNHNTYCILCMECLRTCESENIALELRPWGEDLLAHRRPRPDEAYLALIMLSLTGFHGLTMTPAWRGATGWIEAALGLGETAAFSLGMLAIMLAPALLYAMLVALSRRLAGVTIVGYRDTFIRYAYALLPIALFYHLAHNSEHLLMEGQKLLALASDPLGHEWNLLGTAGWTLPPAINLPTLWLLQVFFVTIGHVFSLWAARRAAGTLFPSPRAAFRSQLPMLAAMILFSMMSLWLLKQPMEMRSSAM